MSALENNQPDLDEAIMQMVNLGEKDPLGIARKIEERYEQTWIAEELMARAEDIIAEMARQKLGQVRRRAEVAIRVGDLSSQVDIRLAKVWVPEFGYKVASELTQEDLRKKGHWYGTFAQAAKMRAEWCFHTADLMEAQNASVLGELDEIPPLEGPQELET